MATEVVKQAAVRVHQRGDRESNLIRIKSRERFLLGWVEFRFVAVTQHFREGAASRSHNKGGSSSLEAGRCRRYILAQSGLRRDKHSTQPFATLRWRRWRSSSCDLRALAPAANARLGRISPKKTRKAVNVG